ncbi:ABC transporter ATP-binding protein [Noviherbaspirillum galbum]|uniref:ABC transporter ATP-binding protein n=1 Tax=Noviherbaspirillum galbum TaxID=2709383 RepID=A0A6B3SZ67_9BURK|nr:ABC transporter ATP-binding protein [Noviherbaspirillum galbum]NEX63719.1 ABC transporter ATP-binding protein [Noviherbaspirillum galbum]
MKTLPGDPATSDRQPALETRGLTIRFGGHVAVSDVSAAFHAGTLTAIVGPNGAGKTTYFNLISGQLRPTSGSVLLAGEDVTRTPPSHRTRHGMGRGFQLTNLFPGLSVQENIRLAVQSRRGGRVNLTSMWSRHVALIERADHCLNEVRLYDKRHALASSLSHGDQRKLEVGILLALESEVFMFDEPTAGMSVDEVPVVLDLIQKIKQQKGKTILLVEHKLDVIRSLADRIVVLHNGCKVADGRPEDVMASAIVKEAYLGSKVAAHA